MSYIQFNKAQVVAILLKFHLHPSSINEQQRLGAQQKQGLTVHVERVFFRQVGFKLASSWLHDMQHTVPGTSYLRYFTNLILAAKQAIFCVCFFFLHLVQLTFLLQLSVPLSIRFSSALFPLEQLRWKMTILQQVYQLCQFLFVS